MTYHYDIEDIERRILNIFAQFNIHPNESLAFRSILHAWLNYGYKSDELAAGLDSLVNRGYLVDAGKQSFRLTKAGGESFADKKTMSEPKPVDGVENAELVQQACIERNLTGLEDIKILEIDDARSYRPDNSKLLYNIYLKLSASPPAEWQQIFAAERSLPRHTAWRDAWIERDYIVINCMLTEIEDYHAKDLIEDVGNSNLKYRKYLIELAQKEAVQMQKDLSERDQLKELKMRIKFG